MSSTALTLKRISLTLICLATLILIVVIIDVQMVFGKFETGLLDGQPMFIRKVLFAVYPVLLLLSYILSLRAGKCKTPAVTIANILFLVNGVAVVIFFIIFLIELAKHL